MKKIIAFMLTLTIITGLCFTYPSSKVNAASEKNVNYFSIVFNNNNIPNNFNKKLNSYNAEIVYSVPEVGFVQIKCSNDDFYKIKNLSDIAAANPSICWSLPETKRVDCEEDLTADSSESSGIDPINAKAWKYQWDIKRITNNGESYKLGTGSHNVVVGIIDTGIDRDHPSLIDNIMPGSKNFVPAGGYKGLELDETGDINAFDDKEGHGSHVAGSIAANKIMLGVAPNVGIRSYRVFGTKSAESAWIINAMIAAANDKVDVMSMSLGGFDIIGQTFMIDPVTGKRENLGSDIADFVAYKRAVKYAQDKDVLIVTSAGNDALNCTNKKEITNFLNKEYGNENLIFVGAGFKVPAIYPNVVTVSSSGPKDVFALYSNYGPGFVDIAAPGGDTRLYEEYASQGKLLIYLIYRMFEKEWCLSTNESGQYFWSVGTSMATPKVSAVAALIIDKYGKLPPEQIAHILYTKGVDSVSGNDQAYFGKGILNAYNALKDK